MWRTKNEEVYTKYEQVEPYWQNMVTNMWSHTLKEQQPYMIDVSRHAARCGINRNTNTTISPEHGYKYVIS
jgi:hypothetical protein